MKKVLIIFLVFFAFRAQAVVINEIAWMGTKTSYNDEWLELYNPLESPVLIDGWLLETKDQGLTINLKGTIRSKSYFLLERTDDTSVPDTTADLIYKGGLNNQGEHLLLLNNSGKVIDEVDCSLGWFAGQNETKKSMERINPDFDGCDPSNWKTSSEKEGTPRAQNSEEKEILQKQLANAPKNEDYSDFSFILIPGIALSLFSSMLAMGFVLKIRQKKNNIKDNIKV
jgi:hypothetical protein